MKRYVLLEVEQPADWPADARPVDVSPREGVAVRVLADVGHPADAVLRAAELCSSDAIHTLRLHRLPAVHRRVGDREFEAATAAAT
jgi:hypothetical protein